MKEGIPVKCNECGSTVSEDDLFCGVCGAVVDVPARDPAPGVPVQPHTFPARAPAAHDSRANTAFVLGIISIVLAAVSCVPIISFVSCLGPIVGIVAIVLGAVAKRDIDSQGGLEDDRKKAQQGMIMGIAGFVLYWIMIVFALIMGVGFGILGEM